MDRLCSVPSVFLKCRKIKHLQTLGCEVELVSKDVFPGDKLKVIYCENCGYIELYRGKKRGV
jgi:predicted nucleic-acid-binding Zn-ribbon protein